MATYNYTNTHMNTLAGQPSTATLSILGQLFGGSDFVLGGAGGAGGTGGTGGGSPSPGNSSSGASAGTLALALNTIPTAQPGHLITSEYHNALRTAVLLIASQLGIDTTGAAGSQTYPPQFLMNDTGPNWIVTNGIATPDPEMRSANGYFPLLLPEGVRLQNLRIRGRRAGAVGGFRVRLLRVALADGESTELINASLTTIADNFDTVRNVASTLSNETRIVNNSNFTYLITAEASNVGELVQLNGFTVGYDRV